MATHTTHIMPRSTPCTVAIATAAAIATITVAVTADATVIIIVAVTAATTVRAVQLAFLSLKTAL